MHEQETLDSWTNGRVTPLGDTAHPTAQHHGADLATMRRTRLQLSCCHPANPAEKGEDMRGVGSSPPSHPVGTDTNRGLHVGTVSPDRRGASALTPQAAARNHQTGAFPRRGCGSGSTAQNIVVAGG